MEERQLFKDKLMKIISGNPNLKNIKEFQKLFDEFEYFEKRNALVPQIEDNIFRKIFSNLKLHFEDKKAMKKRLEQKDFNQIKNETIELFYESVLILENSIDKVQYNYLRNPAGILYTKTINFETLKKRLIKRDDGKYKIFPVELTDEEIMHAYYSELHNISREYFETTKDLKELISEKTENCESKILNLKEDFLKCEMEPYYGEPNFIKEHSKYIVDSMKKIITDQSIKAEYKEKAKSYFEKAKQYFEIVEMASRILENHRFNENIYQELEKNYVKIKNIENIISRDVDEIWKEFLTEPKEHDYNERFAYLVHTFTEGIVNPNEINKVCCTLATNECTPIPFGDYGIICNINMDNISAMSNSYAGSKVVSKEEFFDHACPKSWQFEEKIIGKDDISVWYESPKVSKIILPKVMEKEMIKNNEECNGEKLNYSKIPLYSEVFMRNSTDREKIQVKALFYKNEKGKNELEKLKTEGKLNDFPDTIIDLSLDNVRKREGLTPIMDKQSIK